MDNNKESTVFASARINELLCMFDISMYELSRRSNIPYSTLHAIVNFNRKNPPKKSTIKKICSGFGISEDRFYDRSFDVYTKKEIITTAEEDELIFRFRQLNRVNKRLAFAYIDGLKDSQQHEYEMYRYEGA